MADNQPKATTSRYVVDGMELISVTNILGQLDKSGALIPWAVKLCSKYINDNYKPNMTSDEFDTLCLDAKTKYKEVSEDAMDTGTKIHDLIEVYIKQGRDAVGEMKDEVENGFLAFLEWEKENIDKWIESEQPVFDLELCYGGTLDAVARMKDGRTMVIDFKSSKGFYDGYAEQVSAYRHARMGLANAHQVQFLGGETKTLEYDLMPIDGCGVLTLDKLTGEPEWKDYTKDQDKKFKSFCYLLDFFYENKKRRLKNNHRVH